MLCLVASFARPDRDSKHNLVVDYICQSSAFLVGAREAAYNPSRRARAMRLLRPGLENM